jgi:cell filamentation protein
VSKDNIHSDPYCYSGTSILVNKFDLKNQRQLQETEGMIFGLKSLEPLPVGQFDYDHLKAIHHHFFYDVYEWAGQERAVDIAKGNSYFGNTAYLTKELNKLFSKLKEENYLLNLDKLTFCKRLAFYFNEINAAHPFREGNGRTQRAFCDALAQQAGYFLDWTKVNKEEYLSASIEGFLHANYDPMTIILEKIVRSTHVLHDLGTDILQKTTLDLLKEYTMKQVELTDYIKQKNQLFSEKDESYKRLNQTILILNQDIKKIAAEINKETNINTLLSQSKSVSLHTQGGFAAINLKFQNGNVNHEDLVAVLRHIKQSQLVISTSLNQKSNRSK